jgi:hypothetical protein
VWGSAVFCLWGALGALVWQDGVGLVCVDFVYLVSSDVNITRFLIPFERR